MSKACSDSRIALSACARQCAGVSLRNAARGPQSIMLQERCASCVCWDEPARGYVRISEREAKVTLRCRATVGQLGCLAGCNPSTTPKLLHDAASLVGPSRSWTEVMLDASGRARREPLANEPAGGAARRAARWRRDRGVRALRRRRLLTPSVDIAAVRTSGRLARAASRRARPLLTADPFNALRCEVPDLAANGVGGRGARCATPQPPPPPPPRGRRARPTAVASFLARRRRHATPAATRSHFRWRADARGGCLRRGLPRRVAARRHVPRTRATPNRARHDGGDRKASASPPPPAPRSTSSPASRPSRIEVHWPRARRPANESVAPEPKRPGLGAAGRGLETLQHFRRRRLLATKHPRPWFRSKAPTPPSAAQRPARCGNEG